MVPGTHTRAFASFLSFVIIHPTASHPILWQVPSRSTRPGLLPLERRPAAAKGVRAGTHEQGTSEHPLLLQCIVRMPWWWHVHSTQSISIPSYIHKQIVVPAMERRVFTLQASVAHSRKGVKNFVKSFWRCVSNINGCWVFECLHICMHAVVC